MLRPAFRARRSRADSSLTGAWRWESRSRPRRAPAMAYDKKGCPPPTGSGVPMHRSGGPMPWRWRRMEFMRGTCTSTELMEPPTISSP